MSMQLRFYVRGSIYYGKPSTSIQYHRSIFELLLWGHNRRSLKQCKYEVVVKGVFVVLEVENLRPWDSRTRTFFKLSIRWVNSISDQKVGQYLDQRISVQWRNAVCSSSSYFCFWRWVGWHLIFVVLFNFDYNLYLILLNGKFCLF